MISELCWVWIKMTLLLVHKYLQVDFSFHRRLNTLKFQNIFQTRSHLIDIPDHKIHCYWNGCEWSINIQKLIAKLNMSHGFKYKDAPFWLLGEHPDPFRKHSPLNREKPEQSCSSSHRSLHSWMSAVMIDSSKAA